MRSALSEVVVLVALAACLGTAIRSIHRERVAGVHIDQLQRMASRSHVQDNLMGAQFGSLVASNPDGPDASKHRLLWILDVERCLDCLKDLSPWWSLRDYPGLGREVWVVGDPSAYDRELSTLGGNTAFKSRLEVRELVGATLPSTKLLLDPSGVVVLSDARWSEASCAWSFEGVVRALLYRDNGSEIRPYFSHGRQSSTE